MWWSLLLACDGAPAIDQARPPGEPLDPSPEAPAILRDVALIDDDARFTLPYVPGHRTSTDGRVALRVQGGPPGNEVHATSLSFYLFAPEKLADPVVHGPPGAAVLAEPEAFDVVFPPALEPGTVRFGHHVLCDPTTPWPTPGARNNPRACGPDDAHDCYDLTVITATSRGVNAQLWGVDATVEVAHPKTPDAFIVDVTLGEPELGLNIPTSNEFNEPAVTLDGRLLTGRVGRFPRSWTHPETGETRLRPYDLMYSVLPEDAEPCDVSGWTTLHPMSHAPFDPAMRGRYGLAEYPFRDTEGQPIPDGEDLGGTYPWVDREGNNVVMTGVPGRIVEQSTTRYPRRCVTPGCEAYGENVDWDRGFLIGGSWTHGKFVHTDGLLDNVDWAVGVTPAAHWLVDLYKGADGAPVSVRLGAGRFIDAVRGIGPYPVGYTANANVLDSIQNLWTHHAVGRPVTPRDVVWVMSSGVATAEVAFDDWLDPNALIVASMTASVTQHYEADGASTSVPWHHNGQVRERKGLLSLLMSYELLPDEDEDIHLQNAATALRWSVPAYGLVPAGTGRVEPVALGGIEGRGFWLTGDNAVTFTIPEQPRPVADVDWTVALYVDPRAADAVERDLLTFPDGSSVRLLGDTLRLLAADGEVADVTLPPADGWRHLALHTRDAGRDVTVLVDGMPVQRVTLPGGALLPVPGDLVVGRAGPAWTGARAWIDDLLVLAHPVDPETACNHARGTLVRVDDHAELAARAARSPAWAHAELAARIGDPDGSVYACYTDLSQDYGARTYAPPAGVTGVRSRVHFPEGPLRFGQPRPDSTDNGFCRSCHTPEGRRGLSVQALAPLPVPAEHDRRRQPMQPPRRVFGNVPAGWIPSGPGPGGPPEATVAPPEGLLVDAWLLPR